MESNAASTARLALLLESTGEGIFGIDMDGRCTFVNRAAAQALGWSTEMVLGRNMHELVHHTRADGSHYPECECPIFNAFRRGPPCRIDDEVLWRAYGSSVPAEYSSYPIIEHGEVKGAVVTFVDITERRRVSGHDTLVAECHGMGRLIDTAVDKVSRIITDLRLSILDHQGLWAALEWQAQEFIESSELDATLRVHVAAGVAPPSGGLAIAVFRIFQQMLSNVARHARARTLQMRIEVDGPPEPVLYLDVRDDGVGAAAAALADPHSFGVIGMRERAGHFGGRLAIDGTPGAGTRVRLVMPLREEPAP